MKRTIKNPYWGNDQKTQVICEFHFENGPIQTAAVSQTKEGNPDWQEIFTKFTPEEIDKLTEGALAEAREEHEKRKQIHYLIIIVKHYSQILKYQKWKYILHHQEHLRKNQIM